MPEWFERLSPVAQSLLAGLFTWGMTACGAALVLLTRHAHRKLLDAMLGFSGGVMLAASYWSLLAPAIEISEKGTLPVWFPPAVGLILGGAFLWGLDKIIPHLHLGKHLTDAEGLPTHWRRAALLVSAITLHNIPEGLAVGVAFGGIIGGEQATGMGGAVALALGIGIQNFPEGAAVSLPLRGEGVSRLSSWMTGQASAIVEPMAAVAGAAAVMFAAPLLPYALAFAAGAMIFVVVEELVPESHEAGNADLATLCLIFGFVVMMILDVALG